jgi:hypothetical protein
MNLSAIDYSLVEKEYKGSIIKYYQDNNKAIIDTSFKLKKDQEVEILYVFSYNCSTCYAFSEYVGFFEDFSSKNKIRFEKIPLYLGESEINKVSAKTYFTRKFLKFNNDFDSIIFDLIHINKVSIKTEEAMISLFTNFAEVDVKSIQSKEYNYKMNYRLNRVKSLLNELDISRTPTIIVHKSGKRFMIDATTAGSTRNLLLTIFAILELN